MFFRHFVCLLHNLKQGFIIVLECKLFTCGIKIISNIMLLERKYCFYILGKSKVAMFQFENNLNHKLFTNNYSIID